MNWRTILTLAVPSGVVAAMLIGVWLADRMSPGK
jgi:hypothetical protein